MADKRAFIAFAERLQRARASNMSDMLGQLDGRGYGKSQALRAHMGMREEIPASFSVVADGATPRDTVLAVERVGTQVFYTRGGTRVIEEYRVVGAIHNLSTEE